MQATQALLKPTEITARCEEWDSGLGAGALAREVSGLEVAVPGAAGPEEGLAWVQDRASVPGLGELCCRESGPRAGQ
jgi:hypothetical protein